MSNTVTIPASGKRIRAFITRSEIIAAIPPAIAALSSLVIPGAGGSGD